MSDTPVEVVQFIAEYLKPATQKPLEGLGSLLSDKLKMVRLKNQLNKLKEVKELVAKHGLTLKNIKTKLMFDLLEGIGDVDEQDEEISTLWTNLFVNYIDSESNLKLTVYPIILKQMSNEEAILIKILADNKTAQISVEYNVEQKDEFDNLIRLGIMEQKNKDVILPDIYVNSTEMKNQMQVTQLLVSLTEFGKKFVEACRSIEIKP